MFSKIQNLNLNNGKIGCGLVFDLPTQPQVHNNKRETMPKLAALMREKEEGGLRCRSYVDGGNGME